MTRRTLRYICLSVAAAMLFGAGLFLVLAEDKGNAIFAVLIAAILCRILVLDVPCWLESGRK